jgi:GNAT superfamily N-acetyltransferase
VKPSEQRGCRIALLDGTCALVRDARPQDEAALRELFEGLSPEHRRLRFFTAAVATGAAARWAAGAVPEATSLVAEQCGRLIGHAAAVPLDRREAEIAFTVADDCHGVGLGTQLLRELAQRAHARGISVLRADVLRDNREMLDVLHHAAATRTDRDSDCLHVRLDVADLLPARVR